jgi:hypothetical protein
VEWLKVYHTVQPLMEKVPRGSLGCELKSLKVAQLEDDILGLAGYYKANEIDGRIKIGC